MAVSNIEEIISLAQPLFEQFNIKNAAIFGSFARNQNKAESDVDLLVDFWDAYDLLDIIGLKQELEAVLDRKVDLVTLRSILDKKDEFGAVILKEAKTIYAKN